MKPLENQRHELFAQYIAKGHSAIDAYTRAGYLPHRSSASQLLANPNIKERVDELMIAGAEKSEISVARVLEELAKIAFTDLSEFGEWNGNRIVLKDSKTLPKELTAVVSEVKNTKDGVAFKLHDKLAALEKIGRHLAMFTDKTDHTSSDGSMSPKEPASVDNAVVQSLIDKLID